LYSILAKNDKKCHREVTNNGRRKKWMQNGRFIDPQEATNSKPSLASKRFRAQVPLGGFARMEVAAGPNPTARVLWPRT